MRKGGLEEGEEDRECRAVLLIKCYEGRVIS